MLKLNLKFRILIAILLLLFLIPFVRIVYIMVEEKQTISNKSVPDYYNIFTPQAKDKLALVNTSISKTRNPFSTYIYDNKYDVFIYKMELSSNKIILRDIIDCKNESSRIKMNAIYTHGPSFNFDMKVKTGRTDAVSTIHLKSDINLNRMVESDNLFYTSFIFNTYSISYNNDPYFVIGRANTSNIPTSILIMKKDKYLYTIIMSLNKEGKELPKDLLYDIVQK